jgi:hypothetical protein
MENLEKNIQNLKILSCCDKALKNKLISKGDKSLILTLTECVLNTLNGNVKISDRDKEKLAKKKYLLRKLLSCKSIKAKRENLIQQGGYLQYILPAAITLISTLLERTKK